MDPRLAERKAEQIFGSGGLFCAESVLTAVADEAGIVSPLIPRIATGFCGGMSRTCGTCGAVTGGIMALGLLYGRDNAEQSSDNTYEKVQRFLREFEKEFMSINCVELIGLDLGKEKERMVFHEKGMMEECRRFTGRAAGLIAEIVNSDQENKN